jgi:hypothetical protein
MSACSFDGKSFKSPELFALLTFYWLRNMVMPALTDKLNSHEPLLPCKLDYSVLRFNKYYSRLALGTKLFFEWI